jgi:carbamate kinase
MPGLQVEAMNGDQPVAVVALGGNALLRRGEPLTPGAQLRAARAAAGSVAAAAAGRRLVVTHGNGPQVGLLVLMTESYQAGEPWPLDVLDAETEGQLGYIIELELDNAIDDRDTAAIVTRVLVDERDPAFGNPTKFIGPVYGEDEARALAERRGWHMRPDGDRWRRVVASPEPKRVIQLPAIRQLVGAGMMVVCAGGGGVPVVDDGDGGHRGVEAVIDKDLSSCLLAVELEADALALATDVDAVYVDWGTPNQRPVHAVAPDALRALGLPPGSMGPKVEAACRFVEQTGGRAAIGALEQVRELLDGSAGTQVRLDGPEMAIGTTTKEVAP